MFAYKVVEKGTRFGSNMTINKYEELKSYPEKKGYYANQRRENKEWFPKYFKGTTVKRALGSVGILAFDSINNAEKFKNYYPCLYKHAIIIRVKVKGKLLPQTTLIGECACFDFLLGIAKGLEMEPPSGTIFCHAVEVLE